MCSPEKAHIFVTSCSTQTWKIVHRLQARGKCGVVADGVVLAVGWRRCSRVGDRACPKCTASNKRETMRQSQVILLIIFQVIIVAIGQGARARRGANTIRALAHSCTCRPRAYSPRGLWQHMFNQRLCLSLTTTHCTAKHALPCTVCVCVPEIQEDCETVMQRLVYLPQ